MPHPPVREYPSANTRIPGSEYANTRMPRPEYANSGQRIREYRAPSTNTRMPRPEYPNIPCAPSRSSRGFADHPPFALLRVASRITCPSRSSRGFADHPALFHEAAARAPSTNTRMPRPEYANIPCAPSRPSRLIEAKKQRHQGLTPSQACRDKDATTETNVVSYTKLVICCGIFRATHHPNNKSPTNKIVHCSN